MKTVKNNHSGGFSALYPILIISFIILSNLSIVVSWNQTLHNENKRREIEREMILDAISCANIIGLRLSTEINVDIKLIPNCKIIEISNNNLKYVFEIGSTGIYTFETEFILKNDRVEINYLIMK